MAERSPRDLTCPYRKPPTPTTSPASSPRWRAVRADRPQRPGTDRPEARRDPDAGARRAIWRQGLVAARRRRGARAVDAHVDARHRRGRRGRRPAARIRLADVGIRRADGNVRRHRTAAAAISALRSRHRHHGRNPRPRRPQHVGEALQRSGRGARQLSQERIPADHRRGAVEAEAGTRRARARDPARGHGARRRRPHAEDGSGAEGSDRARRTDAAHRIHVESVADPPPRRPRGDGGNLQQFRPPDRDPLHHLAGRGKPRVRRAHQGADVHLRRPRQARLGFGPDADAQRRQGQARHRAEERQRGRPRLLPRQHVVPRRQDAARRHGGARTGTACATSTRRRRCSSTSPRTSPPRARSC